MGTNTNLSAALEGLNATAPEYRAHYKIGVATATAEICLSRLELVRGELERMDAAWSVVERAAVAYIVEKLDTVDDMLNDLIEVSRA